MLVARRLCLPVLLWGLLCCVSTAVRAYDEQLPMPDGIVAFCFDGDTVKLKDRRVVRLAGIDTPENGKDGQESQYYAREARLQLEKLAKGKKVRLFAAGVGKKDHYGRIIADLRLEDGQSLNELLVSAGAAFFYPHQDLFPQFQERLRKLQAKAIEQRKGLWQHLLSLPLANRTYVGNQNSLRFFTSDCVFVQKVKPRNRVYFGTLMDAFLAGFAPSRECLFWPPATSQEKR